MIERIASWSEVQWLGVIIACLSYLVWEYTSYHTAGWVIMLCVAAALWAHLESVGDTV